MMLVIGVVKLLFPRYWSTPTALLYAQAYLETGGFTSAIFKENNNLFGMKQPQVRKTTATGNNRGHATYSTVFHSVYDYFLRQIEFKIKGRDVQEYVENTVKSNYAEDKSYSQKWLNIFETKVQTERKAFLVAGFALLLVTLTIILKWLDIDVIKKARSAFKI